MSHKFQNDLTSGSVTRELIRFALPVLFSSILQALYSVVDMVVVGQFCGRAGITGVSIGGQIAHLITATVNGLAVSGTVLVAQYIGAKKHADVRRTIGTMCTLYLILSIAVTMVMLLCGVPLLRLLRTPQSAFGETRSYLNICMAGLVFMFGYNAVSAVLRGMGDSRHPLCFVLIATAVNIVLDLVLVGWFDMGAAGAACATVFAQAISVVLSVIYLLRKDFFKEYVPADFKPDRKKVGLLIRLGLPSAVQSLVVSFSFMALTALVNSLPQPEITSACQGVAGKINSFAILPGHAFSSAVAAMAGQNIGAGECRRAKKTLYVGLVCALAVSLSMFLLVELFPARFFRLFTGDEQIVAAGVGFLRRVAFNYLFVSVLFCYNGFAVGAGRPSFALFNACFNSLCTRLPFAYFAVRVLELGLNGVGLAMGFASCLSLLFGPIYVKSGKWKKSKVI